MSMLLLFSAMAVSAVDFATSVPDATKALSRNRRQDAIVAECYEQTVAYTAGAIRQWSQELVAGQTYTWSTLGLTSEDTYIRISLAGDQTVLAQNDDSGDTGQSYLSWSPSADGTYVIEVAAYSRNSLTASGGLAFSRLSDCPVSEGELTCGSSFTSDTTGAANNLAQHGSGEHFYTLAVAVAGSYTISTCGSDFDTVLHLFEGIHLVAAAEAIAYNDDSCDLQSSIVEELTPGTYTVVIEGFSSREGSYVLSLAAVGVCADSATTLTTTATTTLTTTATASITTTATTSVTTSATTSVTTTATTSVTTSATTSATTSQTTTPTTTTTTTNAPLASPSTSAPVLSSSSSDSTDNFFDSDSNSTLVAVLAVLALLCCCCIVVAVKRKRNDKNTASSDMMVNSKVFDRNGGSTRSTTSPHFYPATDGTDQYIVTGPSGPGINNERYDAGDNDEGMYATVDDPDRTVHRPALDDELDDL